MKAPWVLAAVYTRPLRLRGLGTKAVELRARKEELGGRLTAVSAEAPTEEELVALRRRIREVIETGPPSLQKSLVRELVHEIRVHGRDRIQPVFRVPNGGAPRLAEVCPPYRMAGERGFEPLIG